MNKFPIVISIVVSLVISYLVYAYVSDEAENKYNKLVTQQSEDNSKLSLIIEQYKNAKSLETSLKNCPLKRINYSRGLLTSGMCESELTKNLFKCFSNVRSIQSYEFGSRYFMESNGDESYEEEAPIDLKNVQLDSNGMPIGAETDDGQQKGVEILPVKIKFGCEYKEVVKFLQNMMIKGLPIHFIRSLDVVFKGPKYAMGTLVLCFPIDDGKQ